MEIKQIEVYLPQDIVTNEDLKKQFPNWDYHKIEAKVGISQRHIAQKTETAVDLGEKASLALLRNFDRNKIDFLLFCTQSPDYFLPSSACLLQNRLGLRNDIGAFDYNLGCSGYVYGLAIAKGLILSRIASNILLIVSETYSKSIYKKDLANRVIFGDGAAATIISENKHKDGIGEFVLGTDGSGKDNLILYNGAFRNSFDSEAKEIEYGTESIYTKNHLYMNGPEIFNFTIEKLPTLVSEVLRKNNLNIDDVNYFIFHQANKFILNHIRKKINIPKEKFYIDMEDTGNTVSATIPIALKRCISEKRVETGNKIMLVGFGVGYSWGATIITL